MRASELARRIGITPAAVRYHESEGVLPAASRRANGYRDHAEGDVRRLRLVVALRALGLGLSEAGRLTGLCHDGRCDDMEARLLVQVRERREHLACARLELDHLDGELAAREAELAAKDRRLPMACHTGGETW